MAGSQATLHFDGALRSDSNHSFGASYVPNNDSKLSKFRPDAAEAPYQVSDNTVSRKSHYYHEGKLSEYDQPRELYRRVMDDDARKHLHLNTGKWLSNVTTPEIVKRYLAQVYLIAPEYAQGVFDNMPDGSPGKKATTMAEVKQTSEGAEKFGKAEKFMPTKKMDRLIGKEFQEPVYGGV